jgi:hypothetical protein
MNLSIKLSEEQNIVYIRKVKALNIVFFNSILTSLLPKSNHRIEVICDYKRMKKKHEKVSNFEFIYLGKDFFKNFDNLKPGNIISVSRFLNILFHNFPDSIKIKPQLLTIINSFIENNYSFEKKLQPVVLPLKIGSIIMRIEHRKISYFFYFSQSNKKIFIFDTVAMSEIGMYLFFKTIKIRGSTITIKTVDSALKFEINTLTESIMINNDKSNVNLLEGLSSRSKKSDQNKVFEALSKLNLYK